MGMTFVRWGFRGAGPVSVFSLWVSVLSVPPLSGLISFCSLSVTVLMPELLTWPLRVSMVPVVTVILLFFILNNKKFQARRKEFGINPLQSKMYLIGNQYYCTCLQYILSLCVSVLSPLCVFYVRLCTMKWEILKLGLHVVILWV